MLARITTGDTIDAECQATGFCSMRWHTNNIQVCSNDTYLWDISSGMYKLKIVVGCQRESLPACYPLYPHVLEDPSSNP